jgi:hypothetical protein
MPQMKGSVAQASVASRLAPEEGERADDLGAEVAHGHFPFVLGLTSPRRTMPVVSFGTSTT